MTKACCFMCGATFASAKSLNEHLKHVHDKDNVPTKNVIFVTMLVMLSAVLNF